MPPIRKRFTRSALPQDDDWRKDGSESESSDDGKGVKSKGESTDGGVVALPNVKVEESEEMKLRREIEQDELLKEMQIGMERYKQYTSNWTSEHYYDATGCKNGNGTVKVNKKTHAVGCKHLTRAPNYHLFCSKCAKLMGIDICTTEIQVRRCGFCHTKTEGERKLYRKSASEVLSSPDCFSNYHFLKRASVRTLETAMKEAGWTSRPKIPSEGAVVLSAYQGKVGSKTKKGVKKMGAKRTAEEMDEPVATRASVKRVRRVGELTSGDDCTSALTDTAPLHTSAAEGTGADSEVTTIKDMEEKRRKRQLLTFKTPAADIEGVEEKTDKINLKKFNERVNGGRVFFVCNDGNLSKVVYSYWCSGQFALQAKISVEERTRRKELIKSTRRELRNKGEQFGKRVHGAHFKLVLCHTVLKLYTYGIFPVDGKIPVEWDGLIMSQLSELTRDNADGMTHQIQHDDFVLNNLLYMHKIGKYSRRNPTKSPAEMDDMDVRPPTRYPWTTLGRITSVAVPTLGKTDDSSGGESARNIKSPLERMSPLRATLPKVQADWATLSRRQRQGRKKRRNKLGKTERKRQHKAVGSLRTQKQAEAAVAGALALPDTLRASLTQTAKSVVSRLDDIGVVPETEPDSSIHPGDTTDGDDLLSPTRPVSMTSDTDATEPYDDSLQQSQLSPTTGLQQSDMSFSNKQLAAVTTVTVPTATEGDYSPPTVISDIPCGVMISPINPVNTHIPTTTSSVIAQVGELVARNTVADLESTLSVPTIKREQMTTPTPNARQINVVRPSPTRKDAFASVSTEVLAGGRLITSRSTPVNVQPLTDKESVTLKTSAGTDVTVTRDMTPRQVSSATSSPVRTSEAARQLMERMQARGEGGIERDFNLPVPRVRRQLAPPSATVTRTGERGVQTAKKTPKKIQTASTQTSEGERVTIFRIPHEQDETLSELEPVDKRIKLGREACRVYNAPPVYDVNNPPLNERGVPLGPHSHQHSNSQIPRFRPIADCVVAEIKIREGEIERQLRDEYVDTDDDLQPIYYLERDRPSKEPFTSLGESPIYIGARRVRTDNKTAVKSGINPPMQMPLYHAEARHLEENNSLLLSTLTSAMEMVNEGGHLIASPALASGISSALELASELASQSYVLMDKVMIRGTMPEGLSLEEKLRRMCRSAIGTTVVHTSPPQPPASAAPTSMASDSTNQGSDQPAADAGDDGGATTPH